MENIIEGVNIAPKSTSGHFVKNAKQVINLDEVTEAFFVKGKSTLESKNHTTLEMEEDVLIIPQQVYDVSTSFFRRSFD